MEALAAPDELLTFPASLLAVGENGLQILSLPQLQPQVMLLPDVGSYQGPLEGPLGGPSHQKGPPSFAAAAVCSLGANSSIFVAALQHKPTLLYFNVTKNAAVYRQSTPTIVRCLAADSSGSFLFAGDDAGVLTVWQLSAVVLQQGASAAAPNAEAPLQHKLTPLICSWQAHDSGVCCICIHRSLLISAGRDGSLKAFQLADVLSMGSAWKGGAAGITLNASSAVEMSGLGSGSSRKPVRRWQGHTEAVSSCCFLEGPALHRSAGSWLLLTAAADRSVRVYGGNSDECLEAFRLPAAPLCLSVDAQGPTALAFVGCADGNVYILKIASAAGSNGGGSAALLREIWVCPPSSSNSNSSTSSSTSSTSSSSRHAAVLRGHTAAVRGCVSLRDGRVVTAAADGIRLWRASCGVSITHIPPRQGLVLPLEGLQLLLLQHTGTQRLLSPLGLLRQHGGGGGDNSAATALCLLQRRVEQQQLLHAALLQRQVAGDRVPLFRADPRRFKKHVQSLQIYGQKTSDAPLCMQQLLKLSQGAASTLQDAVLRLLNSADTTGASAEGAHKAPLAVDARAVDADEESSVSSEDKAPEAVSASALAV
ncbi:uncharacterized protein LOC34622365 [Cyclospora cayetanensis]|uniref:Uncharacterized protein LOC34622365 n=1 Tax=Cyclospora cayetanensis TaxID=88456 RepID=A0A6P6RPC1_9EIME|nr:uncharacterized protein LOC34622365 [Cyclospora cayetanensis]